MQLTLVKLRKYCEENEIAVPKTASREVLEAAITRTYLNHKKISGNKVIGCFGYYYKNDMNCKFCRLSKDCSQVSYGTDEEKLRNHESRISRVRFADSIFKRK